jgi:hypothetical protein
LNVAVLGSLFPREIHPATELIFGRSQIAPAGFAIQRPGGGLPVAQQCRKSAMSKNGIY